MNFAELIGLGIQGDSWFELALKQACLGLGNTHPNPSVGCVIVKDHQLIAEGYHAKAGELHAEAKALQVAGDQARGSTLYVTLEPCNHFGRTPPCSQAIIKAGVKKVIYGVSDLNPNVSGHGSEVLRQAGIEVELISSEQARALILPFTKLTTQKKPYVIAKIASSLDGKIAARPGEATALTGPESLKFSHQLREACDAIVVGSETILVDNPRLSVRIEGQNARRNPIRIVLDSRLRTTPEHRVYSQDGVLTYVVHGSKAPADKIQAFDRAGIQRLVCEKSELLSKLGDLGLTSLLLEGGSKVLTYFLERDWIDELAWFTAPMILGGQGVPAIGELEMPFKLKPTWQSALGVDSVTLM